MKDTVYIFRLNFCVFQVGQCDIIIILLYTIYSVFLQHDMMLIWSKDV